MQRKQQNYPTVLVIVLAMVLFLTPIKSFAAEAKLYLSTGSGAYVTGKDIITRVAIDSGGGVGINAAEGTITFNPAQLKVKKIVKDGSIFDLWAKQPKFDNKKGIINFTGGTTKPFKKSAGMIFKIYFTSLKTGNLDVKFNTFNCSVLSADGMATNILATTVNGKYLVGSSVTVKAAEKYRTKMLGSILIDPVTKNQYWYVNPADKMRYGIDLNKPMELLGYLRRLSVNVGHAIIVQYQKKPYPAKYLGKFLVDTGDAKKLYYIHPASKKALLINKLEEATTVIQKQSVKTSAGDLIKIPDWSI